VPIINKTKYFSDEPNTDLRKILLGRPHSNGKTIIVNSIISATIYAIWTARNKLKWESIFTPPDAIAKIAIAIIKDAINSHFEIAKNKNDEALQAFKARFEDPLLFVIDTTTKEITFLF